MKNKRGFSLIEILVTVGIFSVVAILLSTMGRDLFFNNYFVQKSLVAEGEGRTTIKQIVKEIRTLSSSDGGAYPFESASSSSLIFYSDIDGDGSKERVRYFLEGQTFKKGEIKASGQPPVYPSASEKIKILATDVINSGGKIFTYYDKNYDGATSTPALASPIDVKNIRLIKIELLIDNNQARSPVPLYITSQVTPRNLKDNL